MAEFWRILCGKARGRSDPREITHFDFVGFAIDDLSALRYVHARLRATNVCEQIGIVASPDDPRDLFGMLQSVAARGPREGPGSKGVRHA